MKKVCKWCNKEFIPDPHNIGKRPCDCCSRSCSGKFRWASPAYKTRYSKIFDDGRVGAPFTSEERACAECGNTFFVTQSRLLKGHGTTCSRVCQNRRKAKDPTFLQKQHDTHKGKRRGAESPFWIVDRTKLAPTRGKDNTEYREWSKGVKIRDGWKCKMRNNDCNGRLESHHILSWREYPELRYIVNNGITLCQFHHPHGKKEELFVDYFKSLVA